MLPAMTPAPMPITASVRFQPSVKYSSWRPSRVSLSRRSTCAGILDVIGAASFNPQDSRNVNSEGCTFGCLSPRGRNLLFKMCKIYAAEASIMQATLTFRLSEQLIFAAAAAMVASWFVTFWPLCKKLGHCMEPDVDLQV
jgi:hypothetical protein